MGVVVRSSRSNQQQRGIDRTVVITGVASEASAVPKIFICPLFGVAQQIFHPSAPRAYSVEDPHIIIIIIR